MHETLALLADSWDVAPSEAKLRLASERVIEVATGVGVGVGAVEVSSPPQLQKTVKTPKCSTHLYAS